MMLKIIPLLSLKSGRLKYKLKSAEKKAHTNFAEDEGHTSQLTDEVAATEANRSFNEKETYYGPLQSSNNQKIIGAGGAPEAVQRIFECKPSQAECNLHCQLIHEENTPRIYFKILDEKASKIRGFEVYNVLQCADISAGDLKVMTKFGSWDSMVSRILIECDGPMFLWKQKFEGESSEEENPDGIEYEFEILKSCMVKGTFPVEFVSTVCKMMHAVKVAKTREIMNIKELKKQGVISKRTKMPSKIREGLPEWVNYIPYRWYSANLRRIIEYLMVFYTIVSLLWAVWQLYRHVDFIRSYLKPIVTFIEHYFIMLKAWFQWLDNIFTIISQYWWHYIKPLLMILVATLSPLFQIFRPLKGIINIIPYLCDPFVHLFKMICMFIKPVFIPLKSLFVLALHFVKSSGNQIVTHLVQNPAIASVIQRSKDYYIVQIAHEALHGHLDPLKAQVVVIRDLIFKSSRKIYYGLRFIANRTYFMILFFKREREYSLEGKVLEKEKQEMKSKED